MNSFPARRDQADSFALDAVSGDRRLVHISLCHLPRGSFECLSFRGGQKLHDGQPKQLREPGGGETDEAAGVTKSGGRCKTRCHDPAPAANAPPGQSDRRQ